VRFTIERLRTMLLVAGVLLVVALGVFLGTAKFRNRFIRRDIPHALGHGIQEEANGFVYTHFGPRGRLLYRIHASKQVQLKKDGKVFIQLHDVSIELYAEDGSRVDRIEGGEFEYNPSVGIAKAAGPVEITLMKPTVAPAIASKAPGSKQMPQKLASAAEKAGTGEIHVKTSGLVFDRNSGEASTEARVEFSLTQGNGSAVGAKYDAPDGVLVLDHDVELSINRGQQPLKMFARHAEFNRDDQACTMQAATVRYGNNASSAETAKIFFRDDGSAERLDANGGISITTLTGGRLGSPRGTLTFDEHNQPLHGRLDGGVLIDSDTDGRKIHGSAPSMDLVFGGGGVLRSAHLDRGVQIASDEEQASVKAHREWRSPVLDIAFRDAGKGKVEPASMHGTGGVSVVASTQQGSGPANPEKLTADDVIGEFGPRGALSAFTGHGRTTITQTTAAGVRQSTSGDEVVAHLAPAANGKTAAHGGLQIESATVDGNVVLVQQPAPKSGVTQPAVRATAAHASYGSGGQWLHLTGNPRVTDGGLEIAAEKLDVSQESGDAVAQGNVKATWTGEEKRGRRGSQGQSPDFGAEGPVHVVAKEADLKRSSESATFKGNVRLWQEGNSISAPVVVLDRKRQELTAQTANAKEPVQVVLVSAMAALPGEPQKTKQNEPSVIQVRGGDLKYSGADRKAVMRAGVAGEVVASTADANTHSRELELTLLPPGNHASGSGATGQVDRMTSRGHVQVSSAGRRGVGEQLVYSNDTGNFVLTGTAAAPPQLIDPAHGTVTGQALIFNSRNDSVRVEGDGQKTTTVTTSPK